MHLGRKLKFMAVLSPVMFRWNYHQRQDAGLKVVWSYQRLGFPDAYLLACPNGVLYSASRKRHCSVTFTLATGLDESLSKANLVFHTHIWTQSRVCIAT